MSPQSDGCPYPPSQPRTTRNNNSSDPSGKNLGFYPAHWKVVIEHAKIRYRAWILACNAFPTKKEGEYEAVDCLNEALLWYRDKGNDVEEGISNSVLLDLKRC
jgi:hypothetical protein